MARNTWIIGSRFTEYKGGQFGRDRFTEWELQPLDESHQLELVRQLLPRLQNQLAEEDLLPAAEAFLQRLRQHSYTRLWPESPLLLSLAVVVFIQQQGNLPSTRVQLYQQIMEAVLSDRERNATEREVLQRVLEEVAFTFYQTKQRTFTRRELVIVLPKICQAQPGSWEPVHMVKRLLDSGLLEVVAHDRYGFRHQTFYEYLTAAALAERLASGGTEVKAAWTLAWEKRTYSRWTEVLRMLVGVLVQRHGRAGTQEAVRWLRTLIEQRATEEGDPGDLGLALALKSLVDIGEKPPAWEEAEGNILESTIVGIWAEMLLGASRNQDNRDRGPQKRLQTLADDVRRLNASAIERSVTRLLNALRASNYYVRQAASEALGALGEQAPVDLLVTTLGDQHEDSRVRQAALMALGRLGERLPVEPLVAVLGDQESDMRWAAVEALGTLGKRAPVDLLVVALSDQEFYVRRAAVKALGRLGERTPVESLMTALSDQERSVRQAAAQALGALGERAPVDLLVAALSDQHPYVRWAALEALSKLGERAPVEPLVEALSNQNEEPSVRKAMAQALGGLGKRAPVEPLVAALSDQSSVVRQAALETLCSLGEQVPVERLLAILGNRSVRLAALEALDLLGEQIPMEPLVAALSDQDHYVRKAAVEVLGRLREQMPVGPLVEALSDQDRDVRRAAIEALGRLGEQAPMEPLIGALSDQDHYVRRAAVRALGALNVGIPVESLVAVFSDQDRDVRQAAVETLSRLAGSQPTFRGVHQEEDTSPVKTAHQCWRRAGSPVFPARML